MTESEDWQTELNRLTEICKKSLSAELVRKTYHETSQRASESEEKSFENLLLEKEKLENSLKDQLSQKQSKEELLKELDKQSVTMGINKDESKLYRRITRTWFELDAAPDVVAGHIIDSGNKKKFQLSLNDHSQFHTTNHLWDILSEVKNCK